MKCSATTVIRGFVKRLASFIHIYYYDEESGKWSKTRKLLMMVSTLNDSAHSIIMYGINVLSIDIHRF